MPEFHVRYKYQEKLAENVKKLDFPHRLEYNRLPSSCDGDPVPNLALLADPIALKDPGLPKGDRTALPAGASMGEVLAVDEPDRGWEAEN